MDSHATPDRSPAIDPLLRPPAHEGIVDRCEPTVHGTPVQATARRNARRPRRRPHPARGARALALGASVVATGAVATALAYSDGVWSAAEDGGPNLPTGQSSSAVVSVDTTSTVAMAEATNVDSVAAASSSSVPSASEPSTTMSGTAPSTTQPAEPAIESSLYPDGVYLGSAEYTEWGDVRVQVTISGGTIIEIAAVEYPTGRKSSSINERAIPILEADAIAIQSAELDIVSGATYTSYTYAGSLQAALDQAALASAQGGITS